MKRLSERQYWDDVHDQRIGSRPKDLSLGQKLRDHLKDTLSPEHVAFIKNYKEYYAERRYYDPFMPRGARHTLVEIGSAPGTELIKLHRRYGVTPYGIEYSESGVARNREVFEAANVPPGHVLHADFFSPELHEARANTFDAVISRGFIEHFDDVDHVIDLHVSLLKPGGRLFISIPSLRGFNFLLAHLFNKDVIDFHNLEIMTKTRFARLFRRPDLVPLVCERFGVLNFDLFTAKKEAPLGFLLPGLQRNVQPVLNAMFGSMFGARPTDFVALSSYLMFVGTKRASP